MERGDKILWENEIDLRHIPDVYDKPRAGLIKLSDYSNFIKIVKKDINKTIYISFYLPIRQGYVKRLRIEWTVGRFNYQVFEHMVRLIAKKVTYVFFLNNNVDEDAVPIESLLDNEKALILNNKQLTELIRIQAVNK